MLQSRKSGGSSLPGKRIKEIVLAGLFLAGSIISTKAQQFAWAKTGGGTGVDNATSIAVDNAGNVYTAGDFKTAIDLTLIDGTSVSLNNNGTTLFSDVWVTKRNAAGELLWAKSFGSTGGEVASAIDVDAAGNLYITGQFANTVDFDPGPGATTLTSVGGSDIYLLKLNTTGSFEWVKQFGGSGTDKGNALKLDAAGNIYISGLFSTTADFNPGPAANTLTAAVTDIFVLKLNASGDYVWVKGYGGPSGDEALAIDVDASGNVYTTGIYKSTANFDGTSLTATNTANPDVFIVKIQASGSLVWAKSVGGTGIDNATGIGIDANGNVFVMGEFRATANFDPGGGQQNFNAKSQADVFLLKLDATGSYAWSRQFSASPNEFTYSKSVIVDNSGNLYISGSFAGAVKYYTDGSTANDSLVAKGLRDGYIVKVNGNNGNYISGYALGGTQTDFVSDIYVDNAGSIYAVGNFSDVADMNPAAATFNVQSKGSYDFFVQKMSLSAPACLPTSSEINVGICGTPSYTLNGQTYTALGTYAQVRKNTNGCDSSITLRLFNGKNDTTIAATACDSFSLDGIQQYNQSGTYVNTVKNSYGCDSTITLNLIINNSSHSTFSKTTCDSFSLNNVDYYYSSGIYKEVFPNTNGCDSTVILDLTINKSVLNAISVTTCDTFHWTDNALYTESGTYTQTFPTVDGCDSTVTLQLTIAPLNTNISLKEGVLEAEITDASYLWYNCSTKTIVAEATGKTFTPTKTGDYSVIVTHNSCRDTSNCVEVVVKETTSVSELAGIAQQISIYPNPSRDQIRINSTIAVHARLSNMEGKTLLQLNNASVVSLKGIPDGMYFLLLTDKEGRVIKTEKIVKH